MVSRLKDLSCVDSASRNVLLYQLRERLEAIREGATVFYPANGCSCCQFQGETSSTSACSCLRKRAVCMNTVIFSSPNTEEKHVLGAGWLVFT